MPPTPPRQPKRPPPPPVSATKAPEPTAAPARRTGIRSESITLEGHAYTITTLDADRGLELSPVALDYVTGPIAASIMAVGGIDWAAQGVLQALSDLTSKLRHPDFRAFVWGMLEGATVDQKALKGDALHAHFASNYGVLIRLTLFAFRENFGSFLDLFPPAQRDAIRGAMAMAVDKADSLPGLVDRLLSRLESTPSPLSSSSEDGSPPPISGSASTSPTSAGSTS